MVEDSRIIDGWRKKCLRGRVLSLISPRSHNQLSALQCLTSSKREE